jgi:isocitrate lyase
MNKKKQRLSDGLGYTSMRRSRRKSAVQFQMRVVVPEEEKLASLRACRLRSSFLKLNALMLGQRKTNADFRLG